MNTTSSTTATPVLRPLRLTRTQLLPLRPSLLRDAQARYLERASTRAPFATQRQLSRND